MFAFYWAIYKLFQYGSDNDNICVFSNCVSDCVEDGSSTQHGANHRHVLEFHLVALPSGIPAHQDLLRLLIYDHNNQPVNQSEFYLILDADTPTSNAPVLSNGPLSPASSDPPFAIRNHAGAGVVYTLSVLTERRSYRLKVDGVAYDPDRHNVLYHTTFTVYIAVAAYPY